MLYTKRTDSYDVITWQCEGDDGEHIDLTGASVLFNMGKKNKLVVSAPAQIVSVADATVQYQLTESDTLVSGNWLAEFEVTFANGTKKTFPSNGYINVSIAENIDTNAVNVVADSVATKTGDFEAKLDSILAQMSSGQGITMSAMNEYDWVATDGQLTYTVPSNANLTSSSKWLDVYVGGIPVDPDYVTIPSTNTLVLNLTPESVPAGVKVMARWTEPMVPSTAGHHTTHEAGGQDEIDITKLKNYGSFHTSPIDFGADKTGVVDALAAFNSALATGKYVFVPDGTYKLSNTLVVPRKARLVMSQNAVLVPTGNFNVIQLKPECRISGGKIDTSGLTSFTMACIYASGQDRFNVVGELTVVDGINLYGKDHEGDASPTSTSYTGKGIHFYSGNNWAAGYQGQAYIAYIQVSNISINNFYRGIWLEREQAPVNGNPWITSCTFDQINMYACMRSIDITTNDSLWNGGHLFTNLQLQANNYNERYIYSDASNNIFEGEFWDLETYFEPRNVPCFEFSALAHENTINGTQFFSMDKHVIDKNNISGGNPMKPNRFNSIVNPVTIIPPVITNNVRNFIGNQDDILAGASKAYTVTKTSAHTSLGGTIDGMFQPTPANYYSLDGVDENNNCTIEINFGATPVAEIDMVGFVFRKDTNNYIPKYIKMELLDAGSTVLDTKTITNNTQGFVYFTTYGSSTTKIRLTFGSSNDVSANRRIRIYRILATAIGVSGKTWLNTAEGGTLYGNLNMNKNKTTNFVLDSGATASRPTSPVVGQVFYDTTLSKPIFCKVGGASPTWTDSAGTTV